MLHAGRAYRSATITEVWNTVAAGEETTLDQRARCRLAAVYASESARQAMDLMYQHGGSTSYRCESRLAECWRDLHVVGQAVTLARREFNGAAAPGPSSGRPGAAAPLNSRRATTGGEPDAVLR